MGSRTAHPSDRSRLLPLIPGLVLCLGLLRLGAARPSLGPASVHLVAFILWSSGLVFLARAASGRDGALVTAAAGGLAAAGLVVAQALEPQRVPLQVLLWITSSGLALAGAAVPWRRLGRDPRIWGLLSLGLLLLPLAVGVPTGGARAWVRWGAFHFQPGEVARLLGLLFLAGVLAWPGARRLPAALRGPGSLARPPGSLPGVFLLRAGAAWLVLTGGWVAQRDLGGAALSYLLLPAAWLWAGGGWAPAILTLGLGAGAGFGLLAAYPHAATRMEAWVAPWRPLDAGGYQGVQGLLSLRVGGFWGEPGGFVSASAVPAVATDLPLAAIAQGAGLLGVWGILYLEWCIVDRGLHAAVRAEDLYTRLLIGLAACLWGLETLLPAAGWLGLLPLTGLPLPLVSRGGTALVAHGVLLGWLLWGMRAAGPEPPGGGS